MSTVMTSESKEKIFTKGNLRDIKNNGVRMIPVCLFILFLLMAMSASGTDTKSLHGTESQVKSSLVSSSSSSSSAFRAKREPQPQMKMDVESDQEVLSYLPADEAEDEQASESAPRSSSVGSHFSKNLDKELDKVKTSAVDKRMLIHTGDLHMKTKEGEFQKVVADIDQLVESNGGYTASRNTRTEREWRSGDYQIVTMRLRIPSDKFSETLSSIQGMASKIVRLSTDTQDVTEEFVDSNSRAETLAASKRAIQTLLEKTNTVKEVMEVQRELNSLTQQYESYKSRAESLKRGALLSTLKLTVEETLPKTEETPARWTPTQPLKKAFSDLGQICTAIADPVLYSVVFIVPTSIVLLCLGCCFLIFASSTKK